MHGDELERFERMKIIEPPQTGAAAVVGFLAGCLGMAVLLVLAIWWWPQ